MCFLFVVCGFEIGPLGLKSEYKLEGERKCGRGGGGAADRVVNSSVNCTLCSVLLISVDSAKTGGSRASQE